MRTDDSDLSNLERAFHRLIEFAERSPLPLGRALAVATFIHGIPRDHPGRTYYLSEVNGAFREAIGALMGAIVDPEHRTSIEASLADLATAELIAPEVARELVRQLPAAPAGPAGHRGSGLAQLGVPVVLNLPLLFDPSGPQSIGLLLQLTVCPRVIGRRSARIRWHAAQAAEAAGALRSLEAVSADAWSAAAETVRTLDEHHAALPPHLPDRLFQRTRRWQGALRRVGFELSLSQKEAHTAGDSIGLALAVAFAGSMIGVLCRGRGLRPRASIAWTGAILPSGAVQPIGSSGLQAKVRAAILGGRTVIVVPQGMGDAARAAACAEGASLRVRELAHVSEALTDPELMEPMRVARDVVEGCTRERAIRLAWVAAATIAGALLAWHLPPRPQPLDDAPAGAGVSVRYQGLWPAFAPRVDGPVVFAGLTRRLEPRGSHAARLVVATGISNPHLRPGELRIYDPIWRRPRMVYSFEHSGLPYEPAETLANGNFSTKSAVLADMDADGSDEIVVAAAYQPYADSFVWLFRGDGRPVGAVYHLGHTEAMLAHNFDADPAAEIAVAGLHGPSRGISILVLEGGQFAPFVTDDARPGAESSSPSWNRFRQPCLRHLVIPMIDGLEPVQGRASLGFPTGWIERGLVPSPTAFTVEHDARGDNWIEIAVNAANDSTAGERTSDYIVTFRPSDGEVNVKVNAVMRDRAAYWKEIGRTPIDFGSDSLIAAWTQRFSCTDYIRNDGPVAASGGHRR